MNKRFPDMAQLTLKYIYGDNANEEMKRLLDVNNLLQQGKLDYTEMILGRKLAPEEIQNRAVLNLDNSVEERLPDLSEDRVLTNLNKKQIKLEDIYQSLDSLRNELMRRKVPLIPSTTSIPSTPSAPVKTKTTSRQTPAFTRQKAKDQERKEKRERELMAQAELERDMKEEKKEEVRQSEGIAEEDEFLVPDDKKVMEQGKATRLAMRKFLKENRNISKRVSEQHLPTVFDDHFISATEKEKEQYRDYILAFMTGKLKEGHGIKSLGGRGVTFPKMKQKALQDDMNKLQIILGEVTQLKNNNPKLKTMGRGIIRRLLGQGILTPYKAKMIAKQLK